MAFAHTSGGTLLVGVENRTRHGRGVPDARDFGAATESFAPVRATRTRLARLVDRGLVREIGTGPQGPRQRYFLADRGPA